MSAEKYWGDAEIPLEANIKGKKLAPRPQPLPVEQEEFFPEKLTMGWIDSQLPKAVWRENKSTLTPAMIKLTAELARKGLSKRAIMARVGMGVNVWGNWERRATAGEQPFVLWYQCVMMSVSGIEEELVDRVRRHSVEDWKAAQWLLKTINRDEYADQKPGMTIVQGNQENQVVINRLDTDETMAIYKLMHQVHALPQGADDVDDAEVIDE